MDLEGINTTKTAGAHPPSRIPVLQPGGTQPLAARSKARSPSLSPTRIPVPVVSTRTSTTVHRTNSSRGGSPEQPDGNTMSTATKTAAYQDLRKDKERPAHSSPSVLYPINIESVTPTTRADAQERPGSPTMTSSSIDMASSSSTTLTFSTVSIPSKVSLGQKGLDHDEADSDSSPVDLHEDSAVNTKMYPPNKHEPMADKVANEIGETKSMLEFLEDENRSLRERSSKAEVEVSTLEHRVIKLEQNADQLCYQHSLEVDRLKYEGKEERERLHRQLMEALQEKQAVIDKLQSIQKQHDLCLKQINMAAESKGSVEHELAVVTAELHTTQDRVKQHQTALRDLEWREQSAKQSLEMQKTYSQDLQSDLDSLRLTLETNTKELNRLHQEMAANSQEIATKDEQIALLNDELKKTRDQHKAVTSSHQSLDKELKAYGTSLDRSNSQLADARTKVNQLEENVARMNEALSNTERQLKEKSSLLVKEQMERCQVMAELEEVKKKARQLEDALVVREAAMKVQEMDIASIKSEKEAALKLATNTNEDLKITKTSKEMKVNELSTKNAVLQAQTKHLEQSVTEKDDLIKSLKLECNTFKCSIEYEKERQATLQCEINDLKQKLQSSKDKCTALLAENEAMATDFKHKVVTADEIETALKKTIESMEQDTRNKRDKIWMLEQELAKAEDSLEKTTEKCSEYREQIVFLTTDIENTKKISDGYGTKLQLLQDVSSKDISELKAQVEDKNVQISSLTAQVQSTEHELKEAKQQLSSTKDTLDVEQKNGKTLKSKVEGSEATINALRLHVTTLEQQVQQLKAQNEHQAILMAQYDEESRALEAKVANWQTKFRDCEKAANLERNNYTDLMANMTLRHKSNMAQAVKDKQSIQEICEQTRETLGNKELQLHNSKTECADLSKKLKAAMSECKELKQCLSVEKQSLHSTKEKLRVLEVEYLSVKEELLATKGKLKLKESEYHETSQQLKYSQDYCVTLQQEGLLANQKSTKTIKEMEENQYALIAQYEEQLASLNTDIKQTELKLSETQSLLHKREAELETVTIQMNDHAKSSNKYKDESTHEKMLNSSLQKNVQSLKMNLELETKAKTELQTALSLSLSQYQSIQNELQESNDQLSQMKSSRSSLKRLLEEEKTKSVALNEQVVELKDEVSSLQCALTTEKELHTAATLKAENETASMKQKNRSDKKALHEKCKELKGEIQTLRGKCECLNDSLKKMEKACESLLLEKIELEKKLISTDGQLRDKKDALKTAEVRCRSFEFKISQLQADIVALSKSQVEFEEYKKKIEAASREEMQRVLAEVTDHMEQQYSAHNYLEKLRTENEAMAIKEQKRQIEQLKAEVKQRELEMKQGSFQIESLELENKYLKSKSKEHEKSCKKIGSRLDKVNDILSSSIPPVADTQPQPLSSSTPNKVHYTT